MQDLRATYSQFSEGGEQCSRSLRSTSVLDAKWSKISNMARTSRDHLPRIIKYVSIQTIYHLDRCSSVSKIWLSLLLYYPVGLSSLTV